MSTSDSAACWYGWLAAVIPSAARRFRVGDDELASVLFAAGAELVHDAPDVEIAPAEHVRGDAPCAVVPLGRSLPEGDARLTRVTGRLAAFLRTQPGALRARRVLRGRGYPWTAIVSWDVDHALRRPGVRDPLYRLRLAERLPGAAVVLGSRRPEAPTVLDEAAAAAGRTAGGSSLELGWPMVRASGVLVTRTERLVLKLAVGPARRELEGHCAALERLAALRPASVVAERVPELVGRGEAGLAAWTLERRIMGQEPPPALKGALRADCLEFLVALHASCGCNAHKTKLTDSAAVVARLCEPGEARALAALADELERELADIPRGFGHGDFWTGNLLAEHGRLSGVVDWSAAGEGRLPLLDVLSLLTAEREPRYFGRALLEYLLPWARAGGDELSHAYCDRLGLDLDARRLEALAIAYWLGRAARELDTYGDRVRRPVWMFENVSRVIGALVGGRRATVVSGS